MEEMTPEQKQAIAIATARKRLQDQQRVDPLDEIKRKGQIAAKGLMTGAARTVALPLEATERISAPFRGLVNKVLGTNLPGKIDVMGGVEKDYGSLFNGVQPQTPVENRIADMSAGAGSGLVFPGAGASGAINAAVGSGVAGEMNRAGMPLWSQILGGAIAPTIPSVGLKTIQSVYNTGKGLGQSVDAAVFPKGAERAAARLAPKLVTEGKDVSSAEGAKFGSKRIADAIAKLKGSKSTDDAGMAFAETGNAPAVGAATVLKKDLPSEYVNVAKEQTKARSEMLASVTPDKAAAEEARSIASGQLYAQAAKGFTVVKGNKAMQNVLARIPPAALREANDLAKLDGAAFLKKGGGLPETISNQNMHYIKLGLDKILRGETKEPVTATMKQKAGELKNEFLTVYEKSNPAYAAARTKYAELSAPVNQAKVLGEMKSVLGKYPDIDESGIIPSGQERVGPFLNVLGKGEKALLKKSTNSPRFQEGDLKKVLTPEQMDVVNKIGAELLRDTERANLAKAGREKALDIMNETTKPGAAPGLVDRHISIFNWAMRAIEGMGGKRTDEALATLFLPENKPALIMALEKGTPNVKKAIAMEAMKRQANVPYAAAGAAINAEQ